MGTIKKILYKIIEGLSDKNIRFADLRNLLLNLGFHERTKGNHYIFFKEDVEEIINLQPCKNGKSKPYQVKQVRNIILKYRLHKEAKNV